MRDVGTGSARRQSLHLPNGRTVQIACHHSDISIGGALAFSGGDWEPHLRSFFERTIRPDWVCLDIGANVGIHTLSMAVLAPEGRVVAFEADPGNFELLIRNVAELPSPRGEIINVPHALWSKPAALTLASIDELAGCCFISATDDPVSNERLIREVVSATAIRGLDLHLHSTAVRAIPLDDWVDLHGLERIDLVKMDVEGAELRVLEGARKTLHRCKPLLVTEYNASCAKTYFGDRPDSYFEALREYFADIRIIEADGSLSHPLQTWSELDVRLTRGRGWEDLLCATGAGRSPC
ncbi:MAG: FkbM family methyltransferase [Alphaproteobacteria bacterium]|nr:FkbM family methyltransferase [Alphaproteobacteria bacterium]